MADKHRIEETIEVPAVVGSSEPTSPEPFRDTFIKVVKMGTTKVSAVSIIHEGKEINFELDEFMDIVKFVTE